MRSGDSSQLASPSRHFFASSAANASGDSPARSAACISMPRAMALAIAMPLISVWTTLCALAGGMLAADVSLGITPTFFLNALPDAVSPGNLWLGTSKSVVFGVLIALIGCHFGLRVKPNTQSLGEGTTASVVTSITVVILVDALFAVLFKNVS